MTRFSHLDDKGRARMVDVGDKSVTSRRAVASAWVSLRAETVAALRDGKIPKGDPLAVARIAGIQGAKATSTLIPLCHPLPLDQVTVDLTLGTDGVGIITEARTTARTGVEMEALTAAATASLALIDMVKAVDREAHIAWVRLERKEGGKSGLWTRQEPGAIPRGLRTCAELRWKHRSMIGDHLRAVVLVVSDRSSAGEREDLSGPTARDALQAQGFRVESVDLVPDEVEAIREKLEGYAETGIPFVLTSGGTGFAPRDVTPEATAMVIERDAPGLAEMLRRETAQFTRFTAISRGLAGIRGGTLIVNAPGSPKGVQQYLDLLHPLLPHSLAVLAGENPGHDSGGAS